jgi:adenine-specific DNA-methyltransferase
LQHPQRLLITLTVLDTMNLLDIEQNGLTSLEAADRMRLDVSPTLDVTRRRKLGQFMTPAPVATFMARMFETLPEQVRLLDAGAGIGSLTAALVHEVCSRVGVTRSLDVTAFEVDPELAAHLERTLALCAAECKASRVAFTWRVIQEDYVLNAGEPLLAKESRPAQYDCAILNPPYAKINLGSKTRNALTLLGIETSNLYTAFVAIALDQLKYGGQLVAITPRSFCNGTYFAPFRRFILQHSSLHRIHIYESRKIAFKDDEVLQENIVYRLEKGTQQPRTIEISSSHSPQDENCTIRTVPFVEVVLPTDPNAYIRVAVSEEDGALAHRVRSLPCSLVELGLTVSTGRVVDFRSREYLRNEIEEGAVPLIYTTHFDSGYVSWPKASRKPNALVVNAVTAPLLVPRGTYVLTKRFTSKEERRRLVAVIYDPSRVLAEQVGLENHLNYFHVNGQGVPADLAKGLTLFLNSTAVDQYFRQFSGHTQVNATDLRSLRYPTLKQLREAGKVFGDSLPTQAEIDEVIEPLL